MTFSLICHVSPFLHSLFRTTNETINWRCANFIRFKCKARAITRIIEGREMVKLSRPQHTHDIDTFDYAFNLPIDYLDYDTLK